MNTIALFLRSMGEHGMAEEVEAEHNRLEAIADGLDKDCLDAQFKAGAASRDAEVAKWKRAFEMGGDETLRQQLATALAENQQLRTNARRVFEQEELKHDQAIAAVIFGKK